MPAPTPPKAQPGRCGGWSRRWPRSELTATTKISALATPASSRSAIHTPVLWVAGIAASVPISRTSEPRKAARERTRAGNRVPASAPRR